MYCFLEKLQVSTYYNVIFCDKWNIMLFQKHKINHVVPNKMYLDNFLNQKLRSVLLPLNVAMWILITPKYKILDGFIYQKSNLEKVQYFISTSALLAITFFRFQMSAVLKYNNSNVNFVFWSVYLDFFYYCFTFIFYLIINLKNTVINVKIVLYLDKALKNLPRVDRNMKVLRTWNWILTASIFVFYLVIIATLYRPGTQLSTVLNLIPFIYFDVNIVYAICIMILIKCELNMWMNDILRYCSVKNRIRGNHVLVTYRYILQAYDNYKSSFKIPVSVLSTLWFVVYQLSLCWQRSRQWLFIFFSVSSVFFHLIYGIYEFTK